MKTDEEIRRDWNDIDNRVIVQVCNLLRTHSDLVLSYIADLVSSLCDVSIDEMLSNSQQSPIAQARWLWWYSYRYMTNEPLHKIAKMTVERGGYAFTPNGIGQAVNKMATLIDSEPIWLKRWTIIKHVINLQKESNEKEKQEKVAIHIPKELKGKVKFEIKEV